MNKKSIIYIALGFIGFSLLWILVGEFSLKKTDERKDSMKVESITANLVTESVNKTAEFYGNMFGFEILQSVPDSGELDFAIIGRDGVQLMFQRDTSWIKDLDGEEDLKIGASLNLFIVIVGIDSLYNRIKDKVEIVSDLKTTFYGMKEVSLLDCNGYILTFAERI